MLLVMKNVSLVEVIVLMMNLFSALAMLQRLLAFAMVIESAVYPKNV